MKKDSEDVTVILEIVIDGIAYDKQANLYTDGEEEFWIPHSQIIEEKPLDHNGVNFEVTIPRWLAEKKGIV